jgi:hypothetical protein
LLSTSILLLPISNVYAVNRSSLIWGARSSGASEPDLYGATWRKTNNELGNQSATATDINTSFGYYGDYDGAHNYQGIGSLKSAILDNITYSQNNYPFTAVVDFDHGVGNDYPYSAFHYMIEDDNGTFIGPQNSSTWVKSNGVYDYEIFSHTGGYSYQSSVFFAFINTCYSANLTFQGQQTDGLPIGMPYAWTHRIVNWKGFENFTTSSHISMFGYEDGEHGADNGDYCYIGFPDGSAGLSQTSIQSGYTQTTYATWVQEFFSGALMFGHSVKDALDDASQSCFQMDFGETDLYKNFTANWPTWNSTDGWHDNLGYNSSLAVYGNGNMYLRAPELTVNAFDSNGNPVTASVYIDSQYVGTTGNSFRVSIPASHTVQVVTGSYTFRNFTGYTDFENPIGVIVYLDTTVTANYYANPPPQYKLTVSSGSGGSTSLSSGDHYYTPQKVAVTAYPDNYYVFDYWLYDSAQVYDNPINVPMSNDHTLQANFRLANPHWVTVNAYNQYYYTGSYLTVYVDGYPAGYTDGSGSFSISLPEGTHLIGVSSYVDDYYDNYCHFAYPEWTTHTLQYLYVDGNYYYSSDTYVSVTSDKTVEAWYYSG